MLASADDSVHPWPTVLVIDDNAEDRTAVHAMLVQEGYTVVSTTAGQGLAGFEAEHPDCVLVDLLTTDVDPLSLCQTIRASPEGRYTSILALATLVDDDVVDDAWLAGCDDILLKPLRSTALLSQVRTAFKLRYLDARLREQRELLSKQHDRLTRLERQNERMRALLLRELTNTGRTRIDLPQLASALFSAFEAGAQRRAVTLVHDFSIKELWGDPQLISRVLENLLDNALRYAPVGSAVRISTRLVDRCLVELSVTDAGPGFEPALRESVFARLLSPELYGRGVQPARRALGLAFCKLAIDAHGGSIRVEDAAPGAAICMFLPTSDRRHAKALMGD